MNTTLRPRDEELRWIDVLLEEASGGRAARQPEQRRWLLAAAIMLLGLSAVVAALLAPRREGAPQPAQEPAPVTETFVEPKDDAELRALLATCAPCRCAAGGCSPSARARSPSSATPRP